MEIVFPPVRPGAIPARATTQPAQNKE